MLLVLGASIILCLKLRPEKCPEFMVIIFFPLFQMVERTITTTLTIEYVEESDYQTLVLKASNAQGNSQFAMTLKPGTSPSLEKKLKNK